MVIAGSSISAMQPSITSPRLCGGMLVAMPTAMPPAPLTRRLGKRAGQDRWLVLRLVVVRVEVDRCPCRCPRAATSRASPGAIRCSASPRRIAVDRAEIALAVDQHQPHGEVLCHADEGVVDRLVAVRVILTHHVADDARRLHVLAVRQVAVLVHGVQDAAMHGLEAVARIRQSPADDHAHRVGQVGLAHLVGDRDGLDVGRGRGGAGRVVLCQGLSLVAAARAHTLLPDGLADLRHRHQREARKAKQISILDGSSGHVPQARRTPVDECPANSLEIGKGCGKREAAADGPPRDRPRRTRVATASADFAGVAACFATKICVTPRHSAGATLACRRRSAERA